MGLILFFLFTLIPVIEIALFIKLGGFLGMGNTILIIILTGVAGAALAKSQGLQVLRQIDQKMKLSEIPGKEMLSGFMILCGGFLLLTPGFLTDFLGLSFLLPLTRDIWIRKILMYVLQKIQRGEWNIRVIRHRNDRW